MASSKTRRGKYRHYKGGIYFLTTVAEMENTGVELAVYTCWRSGKTWARPLVEFTGHVIVAGIKVKRFKRISDARTKRPS